MYYLFNAINKAPHGFRTYAVCQHSSCCTYHHGLRGLTFGPATCPPAVAPQLSQSARHAYVLRPLPARARRLNTWHAALRRTLLGISPVSHGKKL